MINEGRAEIGLMPGLQPASKDQNMPRDHFTTMRCKNTLSHAWTYLQTQTKENLHAYYTMH